MNRTFSLFFIAIVTTYCLQAQNDTVYIMKDGNIIYQQKISEIDSIIFYNPIISAGNNSANNKNNDVSEKGNNVNQDTTAKENKTDTTIIHAGDTNNPDSTNNGGVDDKDDDNKDDQNKGDQDNRDSTDIPWDLTVPSFEKGVSLGIIDNTIIKEVSGLAASDRYKGYLWVHNDSGDKTIFYMINNMAKHVATINISVKIDIKTRGYYYDIEDIAVGPGPDEGDTYVYLGDIGDNSAKFIDKYVYRLKEPVFELSPSQVNNVNITSGVDIIRFQLSDSIRDAEAMIVDPLTRDIYIFSKREKNINLYKLAYPQRTGKDNINIAQLVKTIPYSMIVAADMSAEGKELIIKDYGRIYYWNRQKNESIESMFSKKGIELPYKYERQGESLAFDREGEGYYTLSEAFEDNNQDPPVITMPPLVFYKRK